MANSKLVRSRHDKMIAGVCAGLADYLGVERSLVRIAFVVAFFLGLSASFWIYLILWAVLPEAPSA